MDEQPRRVALFGGSFDPVHPGHVAIARAAWEQARLDEVIFLPAAWSPLKLTGPVATGPQRVEMLQWALADCPWASVSGWELDRPGPSYSWQTVERFQSSASGPTKWFWLMGVDQWEQLPRWSRWEILAQQVVFLVFGREGRNPEPRPGVHMQASMGFFPGSSTVIRNLCKEGGDWQNLVTPGVAEVIRRDHLYESGSRFSAAGDC